MNIYTLVAFGIDSAVVAQPDTSSSHHPINLLYCLLEEACFK